jgi:concanavalin A-like lectin/glucanase superfamily protein
MRRLTLLLVAVAVIVLGAAVGPGRAVKTALSPVGQWHLDVGARCPDDSVSSTPDSSGNGYTAVVLTACEAPGHSGKAYRFPAKWVKADGDKLRPAVNLSVRMWVRASKSPGPSRYLIAYGYGSCAPAAYGMYTSFAGDPNEGGLYFYVNKGGTAYHSPGLKPSQIWDGKWHEVAGTADVGKVHLYLDGQQVGTGTAVPGGSIDYSQPTKGLVIGSYGGPGGGACAPAVPSVSFVGDIDEVEVFDGLVYGQEPGVTSVGGAVPTMHTTGVDQVTATSARVNGQIDNRGYVQPGFYQVEYGTTTAYGQKTAEQQAAAAVTIPVSVTLTGLQPDTTYHARVASRYATTQGEDVTFRTKSTSSGPPPPPPPPPVAPPPPTAGPLRLMTTVVSRVVPVDSRTAALSCPRTVRNGPTWVAVGGGVLAPTGYAVGATYPTYDATGHPTGWAGKLSELPGTETTAGIWLDTTRALSSVYDHRHRVQLPAGLLRAHRPRGYKSVRMYIECASLARAVSTLTQQK